MLHSLATAQVSLEKTGICRSLKVLFCAALRGRI